MGRGQGEPTLLRCWTPTHMLPCPGEQAVENMPSQSRYGSRKMLRYGLRNIVVSWQGDLFPVFSGNQLSKSAINTKLLRTKFQDNLYSGADKYGGIDLP